MNVVRISEIMRVKFLNVSIITTFMVFVLLVNTTAVGSGGLSEIRSWVLEREPSNIYFIYPDYDVTHPKPFGVGYALLSDWTAMGTIYAMCSQMPQNQAPDTRTSLVDSLTGKPLINNKAVVLCGGPLVHTFVKYYEDNRLAPVFFRAEGTTFYWYRRDGKRIDATAMPISELQSGHKDMFVIELFTDPLGNQVFIIYGYGWKGTFIGARFFKFIIYPNINTYTYDWYIFKWTDNNADQFPDLSEININPIDFGNH